MGRKAKIKPVDPESLTAPLFRTLEGGGITGEYLAKKLKSELLAKKKEVFLGNVKEFTENERGRSVLTHRRDEILYSEDLIAWDVRQKARIDAHKLRGDYPSQTLDVNLSGKVNLGKRVEQAVERAEKIIADTKKAKDHTK